MALKKPFLEPSWETKYSFSPAVITEGGKIVFGGYLLSASMMIGAAAVGIAAERKPLELIAAYQRRLREGTVGKIRCLELGDTRMPTALKGGIRKEAA